jgi:hypothetical protein
MRQKQAFRVVIGNHYHREGNQEKATVYGKGQEAGDTIVTTQDLMAKFPQKFERVHTMPADAPDPVATDKVASTPIAPPAEAKAGQGESLRVGGENEEAPEGAVSTDVTSQFPDVKKLKCFIVFERAGKYYLADKDNPKKFANKKGLAKGEVEAFAMDQA